MNQQIILKKNEEIILPILWMGEKDAFSYDVVLAEEGAKVSILGLLLGQGEKNLEARINVTHAAPHTTSEVILKSALTDFARINFEGLVKINPGAIGTHAWLAAHILLLSNTAKGRAIPSLEILENDIKAGHATTVGKVNDMELFYLATRGISANKAKALIVEGFLQSLITKFPKEMTKKAEKSLVKFSRLSS